MGKRGLRAFYEMLQKVNTFCAFVAGLVLLFITLSIFIDVALRYFFTRPSIWITEVSTYLFLYLIFLGTAYALQQGTHIRVTFLLDLLGRRVRRVVSFFTSVFSVIFIGVLLWQGFVMTRDAYQGNWTSPTMLNAPYAYVHVAIVIGSFLLLLSFLCQAILELKNGDEGG
jgi:C4-dicarboxylate transporter, DctQ subunit